MSQLKWKLSALFAALETTFLTDPSSNGSGYSFVKALPDLAFHPMMDAVDRPGQHNALTRIPHVMGAKGGQLTLKHELKGSGTPAGTGVAAIAGECDILLQALFGTVTRGTGSLVVSAGSTTTVVNVTAASGAGFSKYMTAWFDCGATYGLVGRTVISIAADALTLDRALPAVPANGANVYASSKYTRANTGHKSVAFVALRDTVQYTFLGCKIDSAKLAGISGRGTAILEWTFSVTDWSISAKASLPTIIPMPALSLVRAPVVKGSTFSVGATEELLQSLDLDFQHKFNYVDSTAGMGPANPDSVNSGIEIVDSEPTGTVKAYYKGQHLTDYIAGTENALSYQSQSAVGVAPSTSIGNGFGLYIPKAQWMNPTNAEHNGIFGQDMSFKVDDNGTDPELALCTA